MARRAENFACPRGKQIRFFTYRDDDVGSEVSAVLPPSPLNPLEPAQARTRDKEPPIPFILSLPATAFPHPPTDNSTA